MPTFTNAGGSQDGIVGTTASHDHNGVIGSNRDTKPHGSSKPAGNGVLGQTHVPDGAGVLGVHDSGGVGVAGFGHPAGIGVVGISAPQGAKGGDGVVGLTNSEHRNGTIGRNDSTTAHGTADAGGNGVFGYTQVPDGAGVFGAHAAAGIGVGGVGLIGLWGGSVNGVGVMGISAPPGAKGGDGVQGITNSELRNGIYGVNLSTDSRKPKDLGNVFGAVGIKTAFDLHGGNIEVIKVDVLGASGNSGNENKNNDTAGNGVLGFTNVPEGSGVLGVHGRGGHGLTGTGGFGVTGKGTIAGVWGIGSGSGWAGLFNGPVHVEGATSLHDVMIAGRLELTGGISLGGDLDVKGQAKIAGDLEVDGDIQLPDKDIAERFTVADESVCPPGTVMIIGEGGSLVPCERQYDRRVVGVVAGASTLRTAITLGADPAAKTAGANIALIGTAYCRVDADIAPIEVGDLITTSATAGHGMKAADPARSFGAVIGKALAPLNAGLGLVPIVLALQ